MLSVDYINDIPILERIRATAKPQALLGVLKSAQPKDAGRPSSQGSQWVHGGESIFVLGGHHPKDGLSSQFLR